MVSKYTFWTGERLGVAQAELSLNRTLFPRVLHSLQFRRTRGMTRQRSISILAALGTAVALVVAYAFLPKQYRVGEHLTQTAILWNDKEAFLFVGINTEGRATNIVQERLAASRYRYFALLLGVNSFRFKRNVIAYHLLSTGALNRFELPEGSGVYGSWSLRDDSLQFTPSGNPRSRIGDSAISLRWNGDKFVALPSPDPTVITPAERNLAADDKETISYNGEGFSPEEEQFKRARWHRKTLVWGGPNPGEVGMLITLDGNTFTLTLRSLPPPKDFLSFESLNMGPKDLHLSGSALGLGKELWQQNGWKQVSKNEFQLLHSFSQMRRTPLSWGWLIVLAALLLWRWWHWIRMLFQVATMKSGTVDKMATAYSLPPVSPAQFPFLDSAKLDRYTLEFESIGFKRLLDFSLVGNSSGRTPNFCRLMAHGGYHCFAEMFQFFPPGKV